MKKTITLLLSVLAAVSCNFLDETLKGGYTAENYYTSESKAELAVNAIYNSLYDNVLWIFGDVASDDSVKGGDDGDQRYDIYIDGVKLCREEHSRLKPGHLVDQVYKLPRKMTDGKEKVRVSIRGFDDIVVNGVKQPNTGSGWIGGFFHFAVKRATGNVSPERSEPRKRSLEGWKRGTGSS